MTVPDKPALEGLEAKWGERWEADGTYRFDRTRPRDAIYAIDTPPPTASGALHVGHVFSYTHTDCVARYMRMRGREVFYPMGWDDNGLPTERRVQNYYGVRCDPTLPYDPAFEPPDKPPKRPQLVSRRNFIELCETLTEIDEQAYEALWRSLGLSVDWTQTYTTIGAPARTASQRAFLRNLARGEAYQQEAPVLWDIDFQTAVAQAELEERELAGAYHRVAFHRADGEPLHVETTRPELIPSCVAIVAHPEDERYQPLFGTTVTSPLFEVELPVVAHELADPEKGSGAAMICTFGDTTDVTWWRELDLPTRALVQRNGRLQADAPDWIATEAGRAAYAELAGKTAKQAKARIAELLAESGDLDGDPRPITHPVKHYEKGDRPLEIVTSRQWYIRNGGRDADLRDDLLRRGKELQWVPDYMQVRYEHWVNGLAGDWLISRQRYYGVPIPLWYPVDAAGEVHHDSPIVPDEAALPVDPAAEPAPGYDESQRGRPGGFVGDPDIMDTWATSSLTPQIAAGWEVDEDLFGRLFPYDLRPQGQDIIRTWLFGTVVRAHLEHDSLPWSHAAISGWVLDPDRKKMSKSKGHATTPMGMVEKFGADAIRYWAASGRPGADTSDDENQMKVGRRLAIKLLNASRFVLNASQDEPPDAVAEPVDRALLAQLEAVVTGATAAFEELDYARALNLAEQAFWAWTDDYLELVKGRAYGDGTGAASAHAALRQSLGVFLRLFAPFLPYVTEEVWSWWRDGSVHRVDWPSSSELSAAGDDVALLETVGAVLYEARRAKSDAQVSMRTPLAELLVTAPAGDVDRLRAAEGDLLAATGASELAITAGDELVVRAVVAAD